MHDGPNNNETSIMNSYSNQGELPLPIFPSHPSQISVQDEAVLEKVLKLSGKEQLSYVLKLVPLIHKIHRRCEINATKVGDIRNEVQEQKKAIDKLTERMTKFETVINKVESVITNVDEKLSMLLSAAPPSAAAAECPSTMKHVFSSVMPFEDLESANKYFSKDNASFCAVRDHFEKRYLIKCQIDKILLG